MARTESLISTVSDTARWVAHYRAVESAGPDDIIMSSIADGCDRVLNLAAGFDEALAGAAKARAVVQLAH